MTLMLTVKSQVKPCPSTFADGSDAGDTERLEELPLCSCRMEAPRVDSTSHRVSRQCMATESIDGEVCPCVCSLCLPCRWLLFVFN